MAKRDPNALYCDEPSLTQQHQKDECDINLIVERATKSGVVMHVQSKVPMYADVSAVPSYQEAFAIVERATALFRELPWQAREKFGNDPAKMVEFLQKPENREEAIKLGLVEPPKPDEGLEALKSIDKSLKKASDASAGTPKGGQPA